MTVTEAISSPAPQSPLQHVDVNGVRVTIMGTAHVSRHSVDDVTHAIDSGDYDTVAVELCEPRFKQLKGGDDWRHVDLVKLVRSGRAGLVAAQLALSAYQKRLGDQLGVQPGAEMRGAIDAAESRQLPVWSIDRDIGITLKRLVRNVPWYHRWPMMMGLVGTLFSRGRIEEDDIERLKQGDVLESAIAEFAEGSPVLYETLIAERDRYMAIRLWERINAERPSRVLAVVGAGHLQGIADHLRAMDAASATERARLESVPPPGRIGRILPWAIVAVILTGFAIGFYRGPALGLRLVAEWVVINGTLTALGALLARAHPLTVVTGFLAAPLTSLNPTIGAGMVTAAVQAILRPPVVADLERIREEVARPLNWWRNRATRVLLVFVFCTAGSVAATYIAGFRIFEQLAG